MNPRLILLIGLLAALVVGGLYLYRTMDDTAAVAEDAAGGAGEAAPAEPQGPMATPVEAARVKIGPVAHTISAVGSLRSEESVVVSAEIAGRVKEFLVEEGQKVAKDAPLFLLDATIHEALLDQAEARLELNRSNMERAQALRQRGTGTAVAVDEAAANLRADRTAIAVAQAWLDKMTVFAPFEGVLGLRQVSVGEYVEPGEPIFNLESIDRLKVDFRVPELALAQVAPGQQIEIRSDALPDERFVGTVYAIDPKVDNEGRSILVRARVPNEEGRLRPGLFVRVDLIVERRDNAILVPEQALVPVGDDQFVYRVIDGKAAMTKVTVGERRAGEAEITEGLTPEDVVIFEGQIKIGDGAPVTVVTKPAEGTDTSA
jgi:membrane fusion protein (multidrug efflux system)